MSARVFCGCKMKVYGKGMRTEMLGDEMRDYDKRTVEAKTSLAGLLMMDSSARYAEDTLNSVMPHGKM